MMGETIELPAAEKNFWRNKKRLSVAVFACLFLLCLLAGIICWLALGKIESSFGRIDGTVYTVAPQMRAALGEIFARPGQEVSRGQELARLAGSIPASQSAVSAEDQITKTAALERQLSERLAAAQEEEERYRRLREQKVTQHVRAQLAMRSVASSVSPHYKQLAAAEAAARQSMERAKEDFDRVSGIRANTEKELNKVRSLRKKFAGTVRATPQTEEKPAQHVQDNFLLSPVNGRVIAVNAVPNQQLEIGQPVFIIFPTGENLKNLVWGQAWFTREAGKALKTGQTAIVELADGLKIEGIVEEVLPPAPAPDFYQADSSSNSAKQLFTACKIRFPSLEGITADALTPGVPLSCVIYTRSFLGFRGI